MRQRSAASTIIARRGELVVERDPHRPSGRLLREQAMDISYVDLADQTHLEFDYLRWMRMVLRAARVRRVLHIGGGACALPRALAAADPGGRQEVCEVDGDVLALAREHLGLRRSPGLHVRLADGRSFVADQADDQWDAIVIDAFRGAVIPRALITAEAMAQAARVATLTLVNVVDNRAQREVRTVAAALSTAYPRVWTLGGRVGNIVVVGVATSDLDLDRIAAAAAADPSPARLDPPAAVAGRIAGTAPPRDQPPDDPLGAYDRAVTVTNAALAAGTRTT